MLAPVAPILSEMDWCKVADPVVWRVHISKCFWKSSMLCPGCYKHKFQNLFYSASVMVWGCLLQTCTFVKAPLMLKSTYTFWSKICCHSSLFQGRPSLFQQDNAKPHSAHATTVCLHCKRVWVLDWPVSH